MNLQTALGRRVWIKVSITNIVNEPTPSNFTPFFLEKETSISSFCVITNNNFIDVWMVDINRKRICMAANKSQTFILNTNVNEKQSSSQEFLRRQELKFFPRPTSHPHHVQPHPLRSSSYFNPCKKSLG